MTNTDKDNLEHIPRQIAALGKSVTVAPNSTIFQQGELCQNYLLVIKGVVKVFTRAENGREILLYKVQQGESCTLTTSCLLANNSYPAEGVTQTQVEALMIPAADFNRQLNNCASFRAFVFTSLGQRLRDVISLVESVSFARVDIRLANWICAATKDTQKISATHQQIATELGTSREVISRQLKNFARNGWLVPGRGYIEIIALDQISRYAETCS